MKIRLYLSGLLLAATAFAAEDRSHVFMRDAIEGNLFEVRAGELAQQKGATESVRNFGAMLAKDHAQAARNGEQAARAAGVRIPTAPSSNQQGVLDAMSKLEGDKFDENFIRSMIDDHLRDVARYESQSRAAADPIAKYVAETLPTLRDHLKAVQGLQNERSTR